MSCSSSFEENVGTYPINLPPGNCTEFANNATVVSRYHVPYHKIQIQINLTGKSCVAVRLVIDVFSLSRFVFHWWFAHLFVGPSTVQQ